MKTEKEIRHEILILDMLAAVLANQARQSELPTVDSELLKRAEAERERLVYCEAIAKKAMPAWAV